MKRLILGFTACALACLALPARLAAQRGQNRTYRTYIRVTVSGLLSTASSGGTVVVTRTDVTGEAPVTVQVSSDGSGRADVPPGTYEARFTPPSGYLLAAGETGAEDATVRSNRHAQVTFYVSVPATTQQTTTTTTSPTPSGTADILSTSFESSWDGFGTGGFQTPTGVTLDGSRAYSGSYSVRRSLPVTSGSDIGAGFYYGYYYRSPGATYDSVFGRVAFFLDAPVDGILKFVRQQSASFGQHLGGFFLVNGYLGWSFDQELNAQFIPLRSLSTLVGAWHVLEWAYRRNGDPSGYPSVAIWLDSVQITGSVSAPPSPARWINGWLNAGMRSSTAQLGVIGFGVTLNGNPPNTIPGNVWFDHAALSSQGRLGPR